MAALLRAHAAVTLVLVGLIWTIQLVHYPLFVYAAGASWGAFHTQHARRISLLVGLLMPAEVIVAMLLLLAAPSLATWLGVGLIVVIWASTALLQVPLHRKLALGFDAPAHARLVSSNWVRTIAWTARGVLAVHLLA